MTHSNGKIENKINLKKEINFFTACSIIIGNIVGSGIFITSKGVLENAGSPGVALIVWTFSGLLILMGAYCYTELGTLIQTGGGDYAYIKHSYGRLISFLYTYMIVFVIFPCITAIFGITVSMYVVRIFFKDCPAPELLIKLISALTITLLSALNMSNVKLVSKVQAAFTITKILALLIIIFLGFFNFFTGTVSLTELGQKWFVQEKIRFDTIGMSFYNGLFAYSGWNCLNFLTEEMKEPTKNLPRAIIVSIPFITLIYLITNIAYFLVLSPKEILMSEAVALTFSEKTMGSLSWLTPFFISFSTFGALSGCILGASRVYYASAKGGNLPSCFALISLKNFTPVTCIMLQTFMSLVMLMVKDLETLILYGTFSEILFISIALSSIFYFRYTKPDADRPIKVNLIFPMLFLGVCAFLMMLTIKQNPVETAKGILIILSGVPVYCITILWNNKPKSFCLFMDKLTELAQKLFLCVKED